MSGFGKSRAEFGTLELFQVWITINIQIRFPFILSNSSVFGCKSDGFQEKRFTESSNIQTDMTIV